MIDPPEETRRQESECKWFIWAMKEITAGKEAGIEKEAPQRCTMKPVRL